MNVCSLCKDKQYWSFVQFLFSCVISIVLCSTVPSLLYYFYFYFLNRLFVLEFFRRKRFKAVLSRKIKV